MIDVPCISTFDCRRLEVKQILNFFETKIEPNFFIVHWTDVMLHIFSLRNTVQSLSESTDISISNLTPFFVVLTGVAPPSFVAIQAGTTLHQLSSSGDAVSWTSVALLGVFALLSLVPVLLKSKLRDKFD